jgi:hypothetical protein
MFLAFASYGMPWKAAIQTSCKVSKKRAEPVNIAQKTQFRRFNSRFVHLLHQLFCLSALA